MKKIEKESCIRFVLLPILFSVGAFIIATSLQSCNESEFCEEDQMEIVTFEPMEIGSPSTINVLIKVGVFIDIDCQKIYCDPVEVRYYLYGKSNLGGEEELLESRRVVPEPGNDIFNTLSYNTPANSSYRLVVEADTPGCTRDRQGFIYEYTFQTPLVEELQGIVYLPDIVSIYGSGAIYGSLPTNPTNEFTAPLTFEIVDITPAIGAEYISMPESSLGQLVATNLINAGRGEYSVNVRATDLRGKTVLLEDAFTFKVEAGLGEITSLTYGQNIYINPNSPASVASVAPIVQGVGSFSPYTFSFSADEQQTETVTRIMPYLAIDPNTGVVTVTNSPAVFEIAGSLEFKVRTYDIAIEVTNAANTILGHVQLDVHSFGMVYQPGSLVLTNATQVLSSDPPIILNADPAGYTFSFDTNPGGEFISLNPNTGVITASGGLGNGNGNTLIIVSVIATPIGGGGAQMLGAGFSVYDRVQF